MIKRKEVVIASVGEGALILVVAAVGWATRMPLVFTNRLGSKLRAKLNDDGAVPDRLYKLDVELWHPGDRRLADRLIRELAGVLDQPGGERIFDQFLGRDICLTRVGVLGQNLDLC